MPWKDAVVFTWNATNTQQVINKILYHHQVSLTVQFPFLLIRKKTHKNA